MASPTSDQEMDLKNEMPAFRNLGTLRKDATLYKNSIGTIY